MYSGHYIHCCHTSGTIVYIVVLVRVLLFVYLAWLLCRQSVRELACITVPARLHTSIYTMGRNRHITSLGIATVLVLSILGVSSAYKPVVFLHGLSGSYHDWDDICRQLPLAHPGTEVYPLNIYNNEASFETLLVQIPKVMQLMEATTANMTSYHIVCHSQGTFMCRAILEMWDQHRVDTAILLTGPIMGEYGLPDYWVFPKWFDGVTVDEAFRVFYTSVGQEAISVANYWYDAAQRDLYLKVSRILPYINNELPHNLNTTYKQNFLRTNKVVLTGSPGDGVIIPWESAFFGTYDRTNKVIIPMKEQAVYTDDLFGLRTLDQQGRLLQHVVPHINHTMWLHWDVFAPTCLSYLT
eukprot:TRINITY_DN42116_c0_g1_i1.p1 TRINITY_DN42116_c0_g1~~TRINITY_DN42116_c0_g1_i1.p1  ORF type:complete len:354 (-),score=25.61 TRINITY_DN42116_c0_g1_i1:68-1129(-)